MQMSREMADVLAGTPATRPYRWVITKDLLDPMGAHCRRGTNGPRHADPALATLTVPALTAHPTAKRFRMSDDDGTLYYEGVIAGAFEGFEPLDDFGTADAGCVRIAYFEDGQWVTL